MENTDYLDIVKMLRDTVPKYTPEHLSTKTALNDLMLKQLHEGYIDGSISYQEHNQTIVVLASRLIEDGFVLDGIQILNDLDPDYVSSLMLQDISKDPVYKEEIDLLLLVMEKLSPYLNTEINIIERGTIYA